MQVGSERGGVLKASSVHLTLPGHLSTAGGHDGRGGGGTQTLPLQAQGQPGRYVDHLLGTAFLGLAIGWEMRKVQDTE